MPEYGPKIVTRGLSLCLDAANPKSYPGSGNTWYDLTKKNSPATLAGGYSFNSSAGGAIAFNGTTGYASVPSSSSIDFDTEWTIECWAYRTGPSDSANFSKIISKWENYFISIARTNGLDSAIYGGVGYGTSHYTTAGGDRVVNMPLNEWCRLLLTYSESEGIATMYLNDTILHTFAAAQTVADTFDFFIARPNGTVTDQFFDGYVSTVNLYNLRLTSNEISQNYNAVKGRFGL